MFDEKHHAPRRRNTYVINKVSVLWSKGGQGRPREAKVGGGELVEACNQPYQGGFHKQRPPTPMIYVHIKCAASDFPTAVKQAELLTGQIKNYGVWIRSVQWCIVKLALADRRFIDSNANTERNFRERGSQGHAQVSDPVT